MAKPENTKTVNKSSDSEDTWLELPQRLRGRGDFLRERGQVKTPELLYDAATEIETLRARLGKYDRG